MAAARPSATRLISIVDDNAAARIVSILRRGGVVALPTDTVYGLAAAVNRPAAIDRLYALKTRPRSKAIPVLLSDTDQAERVVQAMPAAAVALADAFWPGALTMVLPARGHLHPHLTSLEGDERTVAVRIPDHPFTREVIAALGGALAVTSANRSGNPPALDAAEIDLGAESAPDAVVDGGRVSGGVASTIVRLLPDDFEVLREGAISVPELRAVLSQHAPGAAGNPAPLV